MGGGARGKKSKHQTNWFCGQFAVAAGTVLGYLLVTKNVIAHAI